MAPAKKCRCCGYDMYAQDEDYQEKGTWVRYVCRNGNCKKCGGKCTWVEKVFVKN